MRYHRAFAEFNFAPGARLLAELARPEYLVVARLEPAVRNGKGMATLDLHFARDDGWVVIPAVILDVAMLEARERDPLVWPAFAREAGVAGEAIGESVERWLFDLASDRPLTRETWRIFGTARDEERFLAAREAGLLGAAPIETVARRAAPFVFARRHARGRDVAIASRDAALGACVLGPLARRIRIIEDDAAALAWYDPAAAELGEAPAELAIVDAARRELGPVRSAPMTLDLDAGPGWRIEPSPIVPLDVLFDFTGSVRRGEVPFWVRARTEEPQRAAFVPLGSPVGGSSGRILLGLRRGANRFGGADVDLAQTIAAGLRDEGFTVGIVDDPVEAAAFQPDLVHALGLADAAAAVGYQQAAAAASVPFVLQPLYDGAAFGGCWGATVAPHCYRFAHDEVTVENFLLMMRERRLAINQIRAETPFHPDPNWESEVRRTLRLADVVIVSGAAEAEALEVFGGGLDAIPVPLPVAPEEAAGPVDALVGSEPFVLLHAPVEPTQNQLQAVRAAQRADLVLVLAGPIVNGEYAAQVRAFAGDRTILLGEPDSATLEGLYRRADVYLDAAWVGCGLFRAVRALSRGAALAISSRLFPDDLGLGRFAAAIDPGDVEGMARGLGDAWYRRKEDEGDFERARREAVLRSGVREVTTAIVGGYLRALERRSQGALR